MYPSHQNLRGATRPRNETRSEYTTTNEPASPRLPTRADRLPQNRRIPSTRTATGCELSNVDTTSPTRQIERDRKLGWLFQRGANSEQNNLLPPLRESAVQDLASKAYQKGPPKHEDRLEMDLPTATSFGFSITLVQVHCSG